LVGLTLATATAAALSILGSIQLLGAGKTAVLEISYPLFVALSSVLLFKGQLELAGPPMTDVSWPKCHVSSGHDCPGVRCRRGDRAPNAGLEISIVPSRQTSPLEE
jgi:hypothetical protein